MSLNITDLMKELAAGEEARAKIPELEGVLKDSQRRLEDYANHNQQLELRAKDRDDQISRLMERIRTAEHDRDDALMASMEADEKLKSFRGTVEKFSSAVASALSGIGAANDKLNPPKSAEPAPAAEPVKEPEGNVGNASSNTQASSPQPSGQITGSTDYSSKQEGSNPADPASFGTNPTWPPNEASSSQGESASGPTPATTENAGQGSSVQSQEPAASSADTSPPVDTRPWWEKEGAEVPPHMRNPA